MIDREGILLSALAALVEHSPYKADGLGNGPFHKHQIPGVWDYNGGPMDGRKCDWCRAWADATEMVNAAKEKKQVK